MLHTKLVPAGQLRKSWWLGGVLLLVVGAAFVACDKDDDGGSENNSQSARKVISGTITPKQATGTLGTDAKKFYAEVSDTANRALLARVAGAVTSYPVSGKLEDGDVVFNFKGEYEPENNIFSVQAKSSVFIFSLSGKLNAEGAMDTSKSKASVQVKTDTGWQTVECDLNGQQQEVSKPENNSDNGGDGIPSGYLGKWRNLLNEGEYFLLTENSIIYNYRPDITQNEYQLLPLNVVEVTKISDTNYDILVLNADIFDIPYFERFNISTTLQNGISSESASVFDGEQDGTIGDYISSLGAGTRLFVAPYTSSSGAKPEGSPLDGLTYSPLFEDENEARSASVLHAIPFFTFLCEK
jgi:hypothetical protein